MVIYARVVIYILSVVFVPVSVCLRLMFIVIIVYLLFFVNTSCFVSLRMHCVCASLTLPRRPILGIVFMCCVVLIFVMLQVRAWQRASVCAE